MKLLLDTHFVIAIGRMEMASEYPAVRTLLQDEANRSAVSTCSFWEIAIKSKLGKLDTIIPVDELADILEDAGLGILDINRHHAAASVVPEPQTHDPFDRLLLAQCRVENMRLVTLDRALVHHPLAWRPERS